MYTQLILYRGEWPRFFFAVVEKRDLFALLCVYLDRKLLGRIYTFVSAFEQRVGLRAGFLLLF